jgi:hypothetical protein
MTDAELEAMHRCSSDFRWDDAEPCDADRARLIAEIRRLRREARCQEFEGCNGSLPLEEMCPPCYERNKD